MLGSYCVLEYHHIQMSKHQPWSKNFEISELNYSDKPVKTPNLNPKPQTQPTKKKTQPKPQTNPKNHKPRKPQI